METFELSLQQLKPWTKNQTEQFSQKQIVSLVGPLGAGKTKLVEIILAHLGVSEPVSSPTFSLINHYQASKYQFIAHVDLYRTEGEEDLESTGFWDLFSAPQGLILIEWGDRLSLEDLPLDWDFKEISIKKPPADEKRSYRIKTAR